MEIVVQVNGKFKEKCSIEEGDSEDVVFGKAKQLDSIKGMSFRKVVYVPERLMNLIS